MRRKDREVTDFNIIKQIIESCDIIRLGFTDGDFPYIVPMNFGCEIVDEQIYFYIHGALAGRKADLINSVGFCSFEMDSGHSIKLLYESKGVTTLYKSLMGKAKIEVLTTPEQKKRGMDFIMAKYPETRDFEYNADAIKHTMVARLTVLEYSGKQNPN